MKPAKRKKAEGVKAPLHPKRPHYAPGGSAGTARSEAPGFEACRRAPLGGRAPAYALPDPFQNMSFEVAEDELDTRLLAAELSFRESRNVMLGLHAVALALEYGAPVPRRLADWFSRAIKIYVHDRRKSLGSALGLNGTGKASPKRKAKEGRALRVALSRMLFLQTLGATIAQAAALVSRLSPDHATSTLIDRYKRSGYGKGAKEIRALSRVPMDPEPTLAAYPDTPLEIAQAKAAIRKVYAKRRP